MKNSKTLKENYKLSTIPRLRDLGYADEAAIDACPFITYTLLFMHNPACRQDLLFEYIAHCKRQNKMADPKTFLVIGTPKPTNLIGGELRDNLTGRTYPSEWEQSIFNLQYEL
jgi:hypothetical protein